MLGRLFCSARALRAACPRVQTGSPPCAFRPTALQHLAAVRQRAIATHASVMDGVTHLYVPTPTAAVQLPSLASRPHTQQPAHGQVVHCRTQAEAAAIDEELMGPLGFSVDQLMELAGLSVACSVAAEYPATTHKRVLVLVGPGNNGGDGLVAARHLTHFGYSVQVCYPKPTDKPLYNGLVTQCKSLGLPFVSPEELLTSSTPLKQQHDLVIDALFGFSFKGKPRPPFDALLQALVPAAEPPVVVSVDIPSGWHVEQGDAGCEGPTLAPDMLVSLTAPKMAARHFKGRYHYVGGRFVPPAIRDKYQLQLPPYPGTSQCVRLGPHTPGSTSPAAAAAAAGGSSKIAAAAAAAAPADMRISYEVGGLLEQDVARDPLQQFEAWFKDASACKVIQEPNAMSIATTCSKQQQPSLRMVLLKGYDARGFSFYTNYNSRKGSELAENGRAALCFFWEPLQRSVRVEGLVERLPEAESTAYFNSRPRGSRVGAWVSHQSQPVPGGRTEIEARQRELEKIYEDDSIPVPKPPHWGGFLVRPLVVEFWQGRPSRLHDRLRFTRSSVEAEEWGIERLYP